MTRVLVWGGIKWAIVGATLAAFSGCGESERNAGGFCERFILKLKGCGMGALIREEEECYEPKEDEACVFECFVRASCDDLTELYCEEFVEGSAIDRCFDACEPPPFDCGSGESVDDDERCDGYEDCSDGSDEVTDCPTCGNGEPYADWAHCDGYTDCSDGADEKGCPTFRCANGELVSEDAECDFYPECSDGSDEHSGCPANFECASGERIPADWECDGFADCSDYSD